MRLQPRRPLRGPPPAARVDIATVGSNALGGECAESSAEPGEAAKPAKHVVTRKLGVRIALKAHFGSYLEPIVFPDNSTRGVENEMIVQPGV